MVGFDRFRFPIFLSCDSAFTSSGKFEFWFFYIPLLFPRTHHKRKKAYRHGGFWGAADIKNRFFPQKS
jgi:hypothetical protein